ncbi:M20/M25/M40 family metallo-hydrolase [Pelagerythrobacter marensis]|uniref:M20/M25/M40 family metallo-hydrolase n=1 Tax=Pelagerythrobacter marensis TaxID=543877 RepID=A0ABZ2D3G7_9SPHN
MQRIPIAPDPRAVLAGRGQRLRRVRAATIVIGASAAILFAPAVWAQQDSSQAAIRAHTEFLADDLLEGRDTGTRGHEIAARYVAAQLAAIGVEARGTDGYFQQVPLRRRTLAASRLALAIKGSPVELVNGETVVVDGSRTETAEELDLPLVFVGWGITAPELGLDDYAGVDVRGKAVVLIEGAPATLPGALRAHFSWVQQKERMAAAAGAVAVVTIKSPERERISPWDYTRRARLQPALSWYSGNAEQAAPIKATVSLSPSMATRLFDAHGLDLAAIYAGASDTPPAARELDARISIRRETRHDDLVSPNVVGMVPGSDPQLRDEYVLVLAHLDHVGIGEPVAGDAIYNGAIDNAGGVAVMLEAARRIVSARPSRSVLFVATTGEERGLIGADYFAAHPVVDIDRIVAAISVDGLMAWHDFEDIVALGADHSNLGEASRRAAAAIGARHIPDPNPQRGNLALSDQYPFLRLGIPILFPNPGPRDPATGMAVHPNWQAYEENSYHQPSDDTSLPIRWDVAARWERYIRETILNIANGPRPAWYRDDPLMHGFAPNSLPVERPERGAG